MIRIGTAFAIVVAFVANAGDTLEFNRDIRPILSENCFQCHGFDGKARKAGLRLDERASVIEERDGVVAIVPGDSDASELVRRITAADPNKLMPPEDSERSLSAEQIDLLKRWIDEGAVYQDHWAYIPLTRPDLPKVNDIAWVKNPIDRFVLARLEQEGIAPSPTADSVTLMRRLHFDVTGLPPEPETVEAFAMNPGDDAYQRVAEALIASPHYGERMAVPWLDVVRYADTNGYHGDQYRNIWPYRDYVINAFNDNMPFDQFTIEQLAGDLLPDAAVNQKIASGYNRLNQITAEGGAQAKEYIAKYAADRVRTTSTVWLGTTMGCAECHDHKFDPFTQEDFYSLAAYFADVQEKGVYSAREPWDPLLELPTEEQSRQLAKLDRGIERLQKRLDTPTKTLERLQRAWEDETLARLNTASSMWTVSTPVALASENGTTLDSLDDGSVLSSGEHPASEVYVATLRTDGGAVTGLRLEALLDPSLPDNGLTRGNGNFVLSEVEVEAAGEAVGIADATANYEQDTWPVTAAFDGDPKTGWAVDGHISKGVERAAVFRIAEAVSAEELVVRLRFESAHAQHAIGRFRLALTGAQEPALGQEEELPEEVLSALKTPRDDRRPIQRDRLAAYYRGIAPALDGMREQLEQAKKERETIAGEVKTTLVTVSIEPREVRVLPRGNWMDESGKIVSPRPPELLAQGDVPEGERLTRLDLAEWLVDPANPLPARVTVNRIWKQFFGAGLAPVLDDLGSQGGAPSHPELLDWIAVEFIESDWDLKHIVRLIVTSNTYRQSSKPRPDLDTIDPYNQLLARQDRYRLPAEFVRDNALAVSGLLAPAIGGRSVYPYQPDGYYANVNTFTGPLIYETDEDENQYRRGLYTIWKRSFLHPSMVAFDAPNREECTADRTVSNTPLQSLVLLNDPSYVEAARVFAERVLHESGGDTQARLNRAFQLALSRGPTPEERAVMKALLDKHLAEFRADPESALEQLDTGLREPAGDLDPVELAAWTSLARVLLNLHETITRA